MRSDRRSICDAQWQLLELLDFVAVSIATTSMDPVVSKVICLCRATLGSLDSLWIGNPIAMEQKGVRSW